MLAASPRATGTVERDAPDACAAGPGRESTGGPGEPRCREALWTRDAGR